jgi:hypothetical protein
MSMEFKEGDLVFLTRAADVWLGDRRTDAIALILGGRIARILKIIDWESPEGKAVQEKRKEFPKWLEIPNPQDYRYRLEIFLPEIPKSKSEFGLILEDWVPEKYVLGPKALEMFLPLSEEIRSKLCST